MFGISVLEILRLDKIHDAGLCVQDLIDNKIKPKYVNKLSIEQLRELCNVGESRVEI